MPRQAGTTRGIRWWRLSGLVALLVGVTALPGPTASAQSTVTFCDRVRPGEVTGRAEDAGLDEISGLVASRVHEDVLWANEDSGSDAELVAMGPAGTDLGRHRVVGADATDWEDIAVGPGPNPDRSYLYIGDIGDNGATRSTVTVYRVPEPEAAPDASGDALTGAVALRLTYPGGPQDAEALLVDPRSGDLIIVTKQISGRSTVLTVGAGDLVPGEATPMTRVGEIEIEEPSITIENATALPGTLATGADVSPDGGTVLLRTYRAVLAYHRNDGTSLGEALLGEPCFARQTEEPQGEAVAFSAAGDAYTTVSEIQLARDAERAPDDEGPLVNRFEVTPVDAPLPAAPPGVGEEPGRLPWWVVPLAGAALVAAVLLTLVVVVRRRRRRPEGSC